MADASAKTFGASAGAPIDQCNKECLPLGSPQRLRGSLGRA